MESYCLSGVIDMEEGRPGQTGEVFVMASLVLLAHKE